MTGSHDGREGAAAEVAVAAPALSSTLGSRGSGVPLTERIRQVTQDLAHRFEAGIRRHPEDWHMLQRMWR